jgi:hypothetical protein
MLTGVKNEILNQINVIEVDVNSAKLQKTELSNKIVQIKRNIRENQAALEKD